MRWKSACIWLFLIIFAACGGGNENKKSKWYRDLFKLIPEKYNKVKILVVYSEKFEDEDGNWVDLRVNSSDESLEAYREGISDDFFLDSMDPDTIKHLEPPENGCYTGVFPGWKEYEDSVDMEYLEDFEEMVGKKPLFVPFSNFWGEERVSSVQLRKIYEYGAIPMLRLMPWGRPYWEPQYQEDYSMDRIIEGEFDDFLREWADTIKEFGKPVMVTFGVEMNGNWFPWSGVFQGGGEKDEFGDPEKFDGPERYAEAFRHIIEVFRSEGVENVIWYFHVNHESFPHEEWNSIENYYPGDEYIDWVGFSLYGAQYKDEPWMEFEEVMNPIYEKMVSLFPDKPLMIPEFGVREDP